MACNIQNPTSGSITIKNRKYHNGVTNDGHMTITFGSNVSGYKEDAMPMDYDTIGVGDRMNYQFSGASNSNTFEVEWIGAHFEATNSALCMIGGSAAGTLTLSAEQTFYSSLF